MKNETGRFSTSGPNEAYNPNWRSKMTQLHVNKGHLVTASRIPVKYIVVKGAGQSDFGPGDDPWETTAYDIALQQGQIENCNIVKYTSVLPPEAQQISFEDAQQQGLFHHGMVLECIMAQVNGDKHDAICAGVGTFQVYREVPNGDDEHIGGFAVEYEGGGSEDFAREMLKRSMEGLFKRRYDHGMGYYIQEREYHTQSLIVDEEYGTVLVGLCFLTFNIPSPGQLAESDDGDK